MHHDNILQLLWSHSEKLSNIVIATVTTAAFIVAIIEYRRQKKSHVLENGSLETSEDGLIKSGYLHSQFLDSCG